MEGETANKKSAKHSFGRMFFRNFLMLTGLVIVPMLLVVMLATFSQRAVVEKEIILYNSRTVSLIQNSIDNLIHDCLKQSDYLLAENNINLFLVTPRDGYTFYYNDVIYKLMHAQMQTNEHLQSIYIYSEVNGNFVSNYGETPLDGFFDSGWLNDYHTYKGDGEFFYTFRDGVTSYLQPVRILSLYKILKHGDQRQGVVVYNINFNSFVRDLSELRSEYDTSLSLRTDDGHLVQNLWGDAGEQVLQISGPPNKNGYRESADSIVYYSQVDYTDLYLYSTLSWNAVRASNQKPFSLMICLIAGVSLLVLALTVVISMRIYRPFKKILNELETPAGLMSNKATISGDEEAFVLDFIHGMSLKNEQITEELSYRVALLKQAQSVALQSQINPHFLHNTLDSISWATMRLTGGKNEASVMLSKLAQILRYSLDDADTLVPLRKELDNTRIYLELHYKNCFSVEWDIQETVLDSQVIKIMLQPIVENAIQHGLKQLGKDGIIRISAREQNGLLQVSIWNNGVSIQPDHLASIQAALHSDMIKQRESIGIINVHQRIRLFYGDEYGLEISSEKGTQVTINLPLFKQNSAEKI